MSAPRKLRIFREPDGDLQSLSSRTVAIVGYGQLGRPLALNLREGTPAEIIVADHDEAAGGRARADGFTVLPVARATATADIVLLLVPDEAQPELFREEMAPHLNTGAALVLASGYNLTFGGVHPPEHIDVLLFAPRMLGKCLRDLYLAGQGFFSYVSVEQDATGLGWPLVLALAKGSGSLRRGAVHFTAREEAQLDLFGEQALGPWLGAAMLAAFQVGCEAGLPPAGLLLEMYLSGEMAQTFQTMADEGFLKSTLLHGYAAAFGGMLRSMSIPRETMESAMREALADIQSGAFAQALQAEVAEGYPCRALLEQMLASDNPIAQAESAFQETLAPR
ncbi:MAG: NAD(P)-dependent oxidoreductase [Planctomycetaceae bacterium]